MAYIPPALRVKQGFKVKDECSTGDLSSIPAKLAVNLSAIPIDDILAHFWSSSDSTTEPDTSSPVPERSTLNGSAYPDQLAFVLLFLDANSSFESDGVIYAKTNLQLLSSYKHHVGRRHSGAPQRTSGNELNKKVEVVTKDELGIKDRSVTEDQTDIKDDVGVTNGETTVDQEIAHKNASEVNHVSAALAEVDLAEHCNTKDKQCCNDDHYIKDKTSASVDSGAIPFFIQTRRPYRSFTPKDHFRFHGYFVISSITFHDAGSDSLKEMLERKWNIRDHYGKKVQKTRPLEAWKQSLRTEWAEICFCRNEEYERVHGVPRIAATDGSGHEVKSVNELLKESREQL
ncbi:hypothetical protein K461DRAFT_272779 [Myriangium duriaei CBS 260.36]|uniref:Uncharacterized protein n=1 Tax=Myriangium duriaei CBS 260.36 TaxID=1168546 RepID=A0A9P4MKV1_9PEZI|nr:hypothetical protein K461DRAFT_272779 [Myriangium duriaei CBS 260.36]